MRSTAGPVAVFSISGNESEVQLHAVRLWVRWWLGWNHTFRADRSSESVRNKQTKKDIHFLACHVIHGSDILWDTSESKWTVHVQVHVKWLFSEPWEWWSLVHFPTVPAYWHTMNGIWPVAWNLCLREAACIFVWYSPVSWLHISVFKAKA